MEGNTFLGDIIAFIAIIVSIYSVIKSSSVSKLIANKTLHKAYFDNIFFEFMLKTFPQEIMGRIELEQSNVDEACEDIEAILMDFLKSAKVYKYIDTDFYSNLYVKIQKLEEEIFRVFGIKTNY